MKPVERRLEMRETLAFSSAHHSDTSVYGFVTHTGAVSTVRTKLPVMKILGKDMRNSGIEIATCDANTVIFLLKITSI